MTIEDCFYMIKNKRKKSIKLKILKKKKILKNLFNNLLNNILMKLE